MTRRLYAEWEEQDGVLLAWPHERSDWHPQLHLVEPVYVALTKEITRFETAVVVSPDPPHLASRLSAAGVNLDRVRLYPIPTNDTWARDFGPITVCHDGAPLLLDFGFNGWGLKFPADLDNQITSRLHRAGAFGVSGETIGLILEGGSIETDGQGTILTTKECLLSPNRNPHLSQTEIEGMLAAAFGADRFLWLEHGYLAGDDTDSHIDTLVRLCPGDTILHVACDDPIDEHYEEITAMEKELQRLRTRHGKPYRLVPLPWPKGCRDCDGYRLPATYANFLVINGAVLVPTYRDENDATALARIGATFPNREVIGVDCLPLIQQHGSLHCISMQLPKGVLA